MEADIQEPRSYIRDRKELISQDNNYYDSHTVYIENNGHSESHIRKILDQIIYTHPMYAGKDVNAASKYILNYNQDGSVCMFYETAIYDFIFALEDNGEPLDLMNGVALNYSDNQIFRAMKEKYEGQTPLSDQNKVLLLQFAHPCKVSGQTPISPSQRDKWRRYLRNRDDIALMQMYVKPVWDIYVKNILIVENLPKWPGNMLKEFLMQLCPTALSVEIFDSYAEITFNSEYMEASFKYCILSGLKLLVEIAGYVPIYRRMKVRYLGGEQITRGAEINTGGSPKILGPSYSTSKY
jgi:hypothetical protein